ncbi:caspase family protein [Marinifilum flexuosum]|uniref:caspase family protein n=1 Tax=Marinifilum flexuosum TaxID=1117708 RepID=UPI002494C8AC|nr:caspase family protein [Marinifilum flexuosum]
MKTIKLFWICLSICLFLLNFNLFAQSTVPILRLNTEMHTAKINRISTDANGKFLFTVSGDKTAKLWDAKSGELIRTFRPPIGHGFDGKLYAGAVSPNGQIVVVGGYTGKKNAHKNIYIFNRANGKLLQRLPGHEDVIFDIEFSPGNRYFAATLGSGGIVIYRFEYSKVKSKFVKHKFLDGYKSRSYNVAFSPSGKFASVCLDGKIRLYDKNFTLIKECMGAGKRPSSICFSPNDKKIAVGYTDSPKVEVFSASDLKLLYCPKLGEMNKNGGFGYSVCFSADGNYLYGGGRYSKYIDGKWNHIIRLWTNAGEGCYTDYPVCNNSIMDMKCLGSGYDQALLYGGYQPDIGKLDAFGNINYYKAGELNDFANSQYKYFKINNTGDEISFKPRGGNVICFSVRNRKLTTDENHSDLNLYTDKQSGTLVTEWQDSYQPKINGKLTQLLKEYERCRSTDISNRGDKIVLGASWYIYCTDILGNQLWEAPTQGAAWSVNISQNDKVIASTQENGLINWYKMQNGELLLSLLVHPKSQEWIMYTPSGLFDCSPGAESLAGWHINQGPDKEAKFYPLSQFYEKYYTPNLGARVLGGENINFGNDLLANIKLPPLVEILSPENALESNSKKIQVSVKITDQGGGVDNVQLYLNDKLIETSQLDSKLADTNKQSVTKTFDIALVHGANRIRATAFNKQRTESIPQEITVFHEGSIQKTNLHLLAIGINEYKNPRYQLNYAEADASSFLNEVKNGCNDVYENISITYIKNEEATRTRIVQEFERLKNTAHQEDVFIFYYAGHGVMSEESKSQFYMVPYDVTQMYGNLSMLQSKGISANELKTFSTKLKAQKQLFIIDACQSGGMTELLASRGAAKEKAIAQLARSTGTYWITASKSEQFASEFASLGHGIFTYAILQGLKGHADGGSKDNKITVKELSRFLNDKVPELSEKYKGEAQYPTTYVYGQDFPIVIVK